MKVGGERARQVLPCIVDTECLELGPELYFPPAMNKLEGIEHLIPRGQKMKFEGVHVIVEENSEV